MARYIEAEALKKVMCEGCDNKHLCTESPACETVQQIDAQPRADVVSMERYINAIKTINTMSKVLEEFVPMKYGKWIPCSERLPEKEKARYWVCTDAGYQCECRWTDNRFGLGNLSGEWGWSIFDTPQYSKVIAWMPLPKPYKEESHER